MEYITFLLAFDLLSSAQVFSGHWSVPVGEPGKISKYSRNQITMMGVDRSQPRGVQIQDVARLRGCVRPGNSRNRQKLVFERPLPLAQIPRVVLYFCQNPPYVSGFLRRHAAVLIEIERLVSHRARSRQCAGRRPNRPSRWKSSPSSNFAAAPPAP